jgi:hypothetical protein
MDRGRDSRARVRVAGPARRRCLARETPSHAGLAGSAHQSGAGLERLVERIDEPLMSLWSEMSMSRKLRVLGISFLLVLLGLALRAQATVSEVGVGGRIYSSIIRSKEVLADVLPPPAYIIEAHLIAHQLVATEDPTARRAFLARSASLRDEYEKRRWFWERELPASPLKEALVERSTKPAEEYFEARDRAFFAAIEANDLGEARRILERRLEPAYQAHRRAIDAVVGLANEATAAEEREAADSISRAGWFLFGLATATGVLLLVAGRLVSRSMKDLGDRVASVTAVARWVGNIATDSMEIARLRARAQEKPWRQGLDGLSAAKLGALDLAEQTAVELRTKELEARIAQHLAAAAQAAEGSP